MKIVISSALYIQILAPKNAPALFALVDSNRDYLRQWLPWLDVNRGVADSEQFIESCVVQHNRSESSAFGVFYQQQLVGVAGYNHFDFGNRVGSIGYWLAQQHNGKGIITQVVKALLEYGFTELKLHNIELRCAAGNERSQRVAERLHFVPQGKLRAQEWLYDHYVDHLVFSKLASEFIAETKTAKSAAAS